MSYIEYETVEIEESTIQKEGKARGSKPLAAKKVRARISDYVTSRVKEVLDLQLAQGSMPA
jgi:hypothetical protein